MSHAGAVLAVHGLQKAYDGHLVLRDVSFSVTGGQIVGLIGPNGAGKTTTLGCIAGYVEPTGGKIEMSGAPHAALNESVMLIPEVPVIFPDITVWDHLTFIALARRLDNWQDRAETLLARFRLTPYRDALGGSLSKGSRQKLLIACAALSRAAFLLLDEPLVGLDVEAQEELIAVLYELRDGGSGLVVSTHFLEFAARICDCVVVLDTGVSTIVESLRNDDRAVETIARRLNVNLAKAH